MKRSKNKKLKRKLRKTKRPHVKRVPIERDLAAHLLQINWVREVSKCLFDDGLSVPVVLTEEWCFFDEIDTRELDQAVCKTQATFVRNTMTDPELDKYGLYVLVKRVSESKRAYSPISLAGFGR